MGKARGLLFLAALAAQVTYCSNFFLKLLWRLREKTSATQASAQFICAVKRRSERLNLCVL